MSAIPNIKTVSSRSRSAHWKRIPSFRANGTNSYSNSAEVSKGLLNHVAVEQLGRVSNPPDDIRLKRELKEILRDCSQEDWDGYGAKAIHLQSVNFVTKFINLLPDYISYPELSPEPTGELTMVWDKNGYHMIVGINENGLITYGGTSSSGRIYGDAKIYNESTALPVDLIEILEMINGR